MVVARDLANAPELAIGYLEQQRELRPEDARIEATLERLYERQGHTRQLIELLQNHCRACPNRRVKLRARIAGLWIELGEPRQTLALVEPMLGSKAPFTACGLLEKILKLSSVPEHEPVELLRAAQRRAAELSSGNMRFFRGQPTSRA